MDLRIQKDTITVQKEFLASTAMLVHKVGGVTLDGTKFTAGQYVKAGTAVAVDQDGNGKAIPWLKGATVKGVPYIIAHDTMVNGADVIAGVLESGYLASGKITGVAKADEAQFSQESQYRFYFR